MGIVLRHVADAAAQFRGFVGAQRDSPHGRHPRRVSAGPAGFSAAWICRNRWDQQAHNAIFQGEAQALQCNSGAVPYLKALNEIRDVSWGLRALASGFGLQASGFRLRLRFVRC